MITGTEPGPLFNVSAMTTDIPGGEVNTIESSLTRAGKVSPIVQQVETALIELNALLNEQVNDRYLFGGINANERAPVVDLRRLRAGASTLAFAASDRELRRELSVVARSLDRGGEPLRLVAAPEPRGSTGRRGRVPLITLGSVMPARDASDAAAPDRDGAFRSTARTLAVFLGYLDGRLGARSETFMGRILHDIMFIENQPEIFFTTMYIAVLVLVVQGLLMYPPRWFRFGKKAEPVVAVA